MDLFEKWLNNKESSWIKRALTDNSYKNVFQNKYKKEYTDKTNFELATFGDAIIKFCFCEILLDNVNKLTEEKKKYESDETLVKIIAKKYKILDYIHMDSSDKKIPTDYDYNSEEENEKNSRKYIATAVEAMIGAIYKEIKTYKPIIKLLKEWKKEVDANN